MKTMESSKEVYNYVLALIVSSKNLHNKQKHTAA